MRTAIGTLLCLVIALAAAAAPSRANTSHAGWPQVTGLLLMNKDDGTRPLDAQPGADPFDGQDASYSCDGVHRGRRCLRGNPHRLHRGWIVPADIGHNELLGGHGSDVIHAGPAGDVLWGDYKPSGQPTDQHDQLFGGPGDDFIYASHGFNTITTGGGVDVVHAHFGQGSITCDSPTVTVFLSRRGRHRYRLHGCTHISYKTLGY